MAPRRAGGSLEGLLQALRLPQLGNAGARGCGLGWDGSDMARSRSRCASIPECGAAGVLDLSDWHVASFLGSDGPWSAIRAWLSITNEEWSFGSVALWVGAGDVELFLCVERVLESRAVEEFVSHGDGGKEGERKGKPNKDAGGIRLGLTKAMGQEVETEVPRAAEAGLYTGEDKGRLCALVRAQLVRAQHADAAPGAVDKEMSISGI
ncbi:predicted protein [Postia placenta Mad-698-R]|nr:predicted protein [Postia placenta Mad-698-R]